MAIIFSPVCLFRCGIWYLRISSKNNAIYRGLIAKHKHTSFALPCSLTPEGQNIVNLQSCTLRCFHSSLKAETEKDKSKQLIVQEELFTSLEHKDKSAFLLALQTFMDHNTLRKNHIEFIYTAMKHLQDHGVHKDLEVYKTLMCVFPPGRFVPQNAIQAAFFHFPAHQDCAINLLDKMEMHGVCPDLEMRKIIVERFGDRGEVFKKYARMMYWLPKFKHMSPFPLPAKIPNDSLEAAKLAISQMMVDLQSSITIFQSADLGDSLDKTWIVSGQSPTQQELISSQEDDVPFYVEGPFFVWLRQSSITYFTLIAENTLVVSINEDEDPDDISNLESVILNPNKVQSLMKIASVHEQEDGTVLALCATGTSSRDSLLSWIRFLQENNPRLKTNPIIFTLKAPSKELVSMNQKHQENTGTVDSKVV